MKKNKHTTCSLHRRRIEKLEIVLRLAFALLKILELYILFNHL